MATLLRESRSFWGLTCQSGGVACTLGTHSPHSSGNSLWKLNLLGCGNTGFPSALQGFWPRLESPPQKCAESSAENSWWEPLQNPGLCLWTPPIFPALPSTVSSSQETTSVPLLLPGPQTLKAVSWGNHRGHLTCSLSGITVLWCLLLMKLLFHVLSVFSLLKVGGKSRPCDSISVNGMPLSLSAT